MEEGKTYKLGDIASVQTGPFGSQLHNEDYVDVGTPIVTVEHLGAKFFSTQNLPKVSQQDCIRLSKYSLKEGDIVFSRVGSVDRCSYVSEAENGWLFSGRCLRVRAGELVYPDYLYYYFQKESVKQEIRNVAVGATMPSINTKLLSDLLVELPPYDHQIKVAKILVSIDEKIQLNNRINHNLEEQAQALYKSWFVDFEPFKDGEFVDSEFGYIPNGWRLGKLSELVEVRYGKDHKLLKDGRIPVYGSGGLMRYADRALFESESVLIPRKGTLSNVMYVDHPFWTVDTMFYTIGKIEHVIKYAHLFLLTQDLASMNAGSAVPSMTTDILNKLPVLIPTYEVLRDFDAIVSALYLIIGRDRAENASLASSRDSILPKLMSGAIDFNTLNC